MSESTVKSSNHRYVLGIDVGTTVIKGHVYDESAQVIGKSRKRVELHYPQRGYVEIKPEVLWSSFLEVCKSAIASAELDAKQIEAIGISTLRNSFITWNKKSGIPYHNFITWKDTRADDICTEWNNSLTIRSMNAASHALYRITRIKRLIAMSIFRITNQMVVSKLIWALREFESIRKDADKGEVLFGTIECYLVWKLTNGVVHATDPSNACISGLYGPFTMSWSNMIMKLFNIPRSILPEVRDTNGGFGVTHASIFGCEIAIGAVIGDQQSAVFGECCFSEGDAKATLGTGTFLNVNTGANAHASFKGIYPVVGWRLKNQPPTYLAECCSNDTGATIVWAKTVNLFDMDEALNDVEKEAATTGGVCFVPAFSGMQAPYADSQATSAFIGITPETTKAQMLRSVLESIAFRMKQLYGIMCEECTECLPTKLMVDGGVSNNDFIISMISNLIGKEVVRDAHREMSSRGAAFLAGLYAGIWKDEEELKKFVRHEKMFHPRVSDTKHLERDFKRWEEAVQRCLKWYS